MRKPILYFAAICSLSIIAGCGGGSGNSNSSSSGSSSENTQVTVTFANGSAPMQIWVQTDSSGFVGLGGQSTGLSTNFTFMVPSSPGRYILAYSCSPVAVAGSQPDQLIPAGVGFVFEATLADGTNLNLGCGPPPPAVPPANVSPASGMVDASAIAGATTFDVLATSADFSGTPIEPYALSFNFSVPVGSDDFVVDAY